MPFFSVIIPLYNKGNYIKKTIQQVLKQRFSDFEIIVINDGSTDHGLGEVNSITDHRLKIYTTTNNGVSAARNLGILKSTAEYIAFLDADDYWLDHHLETHYKAIVTYPNHIWFSNAYYIKNSKKNTIKAQYSTPCNVEICVIEDYFKGSLIDALAWTSAVVVRKKECIDLGLFNTEITSGQDIDLWITYGLKYPIVFSNTYTSIYYKHIRGSLSKQNHQLLKYNLFNSYNTIAKTHNSFQQYLTLNKYALAIQCKLHKNNTLFKALKVDINTSQLNFKQKILIALPYRLLRVLKTIHHFLIHHNIYLSSYS